MGNMVAQAALLLWPVVTLALFLMLSTQRAIVASLVGAYLLLPYKFGFNFPGVPILDKNSVPNLAVFLLALVLGRGSEFRWIRSVPVNLLMFGYVFGPILTALTNPDTVTIGTLQLPGLTLYDSFSTATGRAIELMPFILGVGFLGKESAHRDILRIFVVAAIAYTPLIFLEILKGPFLQAKLYGVDPGDYFIQQVRGGGFRAMVLMGHGLIVSSFLGLSILAAIGMWRAKSRVWGIPALACAGYLFAVLVLNKSASALLFVLMIGPLLAFLSSRRFVSIGLALGLVLVSYPALRAGGLVPIEAVRTVASVYSKERAASLDFRLRNEEVLLRHANERPWFGWGGYNRNRVFILTGWGETKDLTETDGTWIIIMGISGWLGYVSMFGLLCYPFMHLFRRRRMDISPATAALIAMLLINLLDLIPNSSLRPVTWLIVGALGGFTGVRAARSSPRTALVSASAKPLPAT
jgi:hypothetical protein